MNLKKVLCAALSTVTAVSLLASCGGKGKMQMDKAELRQQLLDGLCSKEFR